MFRVIGDTIEYDQLPVATILPSVWPTRRDTIQQSLENYSPDTESTLTGDLDEAKDNLGELRQDNERLSEQIDVLEDRISELERTINDLEDVDNSEAIALIRACLEHFAPSSKMAREALALIDELK